MKPTGPPGQVVANWLSDKYSVVTSLSQLSELAEVLSRPRLMRQFKYPQRDTENLVRLIASRAAVMQTSGELRICRDPDDDAIVEAAIRGRARYLVTRDDDLKRDLDLIKMARRHRVRVVSVRRFLRRLAGQVQR